MATVKPILRIFDYAKAIEFYLDWLGFRLDWEHRPEGSPGYLQITRGDITLHLSEHHGDCAPGARVFVDDFAGLNGYHAHLLARNPYPHHRLGLDTPFYDPTALEMTVIDPFHNRLTFVERG